MGTPHQEGSAVPGRSSLIAGGGSGALATGHRVVPGPRCLEMGPRFDELSVGKPGGLPITKGGEDKCARRGGPRRPSPFSRPH